MFHHQFRAVVIVVGGCYVFQLQMPRESHLISYNWWGYFHFISFFKFICYSPWRAFGSRPVIFIVMAESTPGNLIDRPVGHNFQYCIFLPLRKTFPARQFQQFISLYTYIIHIMTCRTVCIFNGVESCSKTCLWCSLAILQRLSSKNCMYTHVKFWCTRTLKGACPKRGLVQRNWMMLQ